jgi:hypothetical protein
VPLALSFIPIMFFNHKEWLGAILMAGVQVGLLYLFSATPF